eukprot:6700024-Pyramimonas_sp.AAC.1
MALGIQADKRANRASKPAGHEPQRVGLLQPGSQLRRQRARVRRLTVRACPGHRAQPRDGPQ